MDSCAFAGMTISRNLFRFLVKSFVQTRSSKKTIAEDKVKELEDKIKTLEEKNKQIMSVALHQGNIINTFKYYDLNTNRTHLFPILVPKYIRNKMTEVNDEIDKLPADIRDQFDDVVIYPVI